MAEETTHGALHNPLLEHGGMESLLNQADDAIASLNPPAQQAAEVEAENSTDVSAGVQAECFDLSEFPESTDEADSAALDLINDVELDLRIELGRTHMCLADVLKLRRGSVVTLDKLAGEPVDVYVNGRLVARGEVLVLNENFCIRVSELVTGDSVTRKSTSSS